MVSPQAVLIAAALAITWFVGAETVKGVKWLGHEVKAGIHHVIHPHQQDAQK